MPSSLPPVTSLSDDGSDCEQNALPVPSSSSSTAWLNRLQPSAPNLAARLARLSQSICKCSRSSSRFKRPSCFLQFQDKLDAVQALRREIAALHKLDANNKVPYMQCLHFFFEVFLLVNVSLSKKSLVSFLPAT